MAQKTVIGQSGVPTAAQLGELCRQIDEGIIDRQIMQKFLEKIKKVTIEKLFKEIQDLFKKVSPNNNYVENDILNWFDSKLVNKESSEFKKGTFVSILKETMSHRDLIETEIEAGTYQEFTLLQGLQKVVELLKNGEIEKRKKGIIICLSTKTKFGKSCNLFVRREYINDRLFLGVRELYYHGVRRIESGILSGEKNP